MITHEHDHNRGLSVKHRSIVPALEDREMSFATSFRQIMGTGGESHLELPDSTAYNGCVRRAVAMAGTC